MFSSLAYNEIMSEIPLDEFYIWGPFQSSNNFDTELWKHFEVAVKFGRFRWMKKVRCLRCRTLVGWSGCTGNLRNHIRRHHPEIHIKDEEIKDVIQRIVSQPPEVYIETVIRLIKECPVDRDRIAGSSLPKKGGKYPVWNLFSLYKYGKRYVRCEICRREVYWNQRGLERLSRHIDKIHLGCKDRRKEDDLYRFAIILGRDQFIKLVG